MHLHYFCYCKLNKLAKMKRIVKIGLSAFLVFLISAGISNAQEKKNEQRIKIIVSDKSGTKVEIDTLIKDGVSADSIKLKNGEVIYLARHYSAGSAKHISGSKGQMFVTVSSDDSAHLRQTGDGGEIIIVKNGKHIIEGKGGKVVTWSSSEGDSEGADYIYIKEDKKSLKDGEKTINVKVTTDENENIEKTKYIIAKDGMVVTVEGNDDAKVKDLIKEIESKLGVSRDAKNTKPTVKQETGKTIKK
jgi:hypothetical protein